MWVPGAIAATSAAMVMRNPADAARDPDGPTNTDHRRLRGEDGGVDVAGRVDQPAGRAKRDHDARPLRRRPPARSRRAGIRTTTGWMMPSTSARYTTGAAPAPAAAGCGRLRLREEPGATARPAGRPDTSARIPAAPDNRESRMCLLISSLLELNPCEHALRLGGRRVHGERPLRLDRAPLGRHRSSGTPRPAPRGPRRRRHSRWKSSARRPPRRVGRHEVMRPISRCACASYGDR